MEQSFFVIWIIKFEERAISKPFCPKLAWLAKRTAASIASWSPEGTLRVPLAGTPTKLLTTLIIQLRRPFIFLDGIPSVHDKGLPRYVRGLS